MTDLDFQKLLTAIRSGALSASQMEDVVYAMHAAYTDHEQGIDAWLSTGLEDFADTMVLARKTAEKFQLEGDAA